MACNESMEGNEGGRRTMTWGRTFQIENSKCKIPEWSIPDKDPAFSLSEVRNRHQVLCKVAIFDLFNKISLVTVESKPDT